MVTTWILILSLMTGDYRGGTAIHSVGPFANVEQCTRAGNLWLRQVRSIDQYQINLKAAAVCIQTTATQPAVTY